MSNLNLCNLKDKVSGRVFTNIEDINECYGVNLKLPSNTPTGCNILHYNVEGLYTVRLCSYYKEDAEGLFYHANNHEWLDSGNITLEQEIVDDIDNEYLDIIYLRLTQQEDDKPKFVPECLLGVETDRGHIIATEQDVVVCEGSGGWFVDGLRYYISDDSDETVSLDEYIKLFYNTENTL